MSIETETRDLVARRVAAIGTLSALNAEALKLQQALGAAEMEVLRLELAVERAAAEPDPQLVRDLQKAGEDAASVRSAQEGCDDRIAAAELVVDEIDRRLAAGRDATREEQRP